jgi:hypothetical protein
MPIARPARLVRPASASAGPNQADQAISHDISK